jgi:methionine synthase II (cobalamin-independent)
MRVTSGIQTLAASSLVFRVELAAEICVDEPSMSCYAYREDPARLVDIFNRTVAGLRGRCRLSTHLCFGNYKGRAVAPRQYAPMFPAFLDLEVEEVHLEMASREFAEIELIGRIAERMDVAVGINEATTLRRPKMSPRGCAAVLNLRRRSGSRSLRIAA